MSFFETTSRIRSLGSNIKEEDKNTDAYAVANFYADITGGPGFARGVLSATTQDNPVVGDYIMPVMTDRGKPEVVKVTYHGPDTMAGRFVDSGTSTLEGMFNSWVRSASRVVATGAEALGAEKWASEFDKYYALDKARVDLDREINTTPPSGKIEAIVNVIPNLVGSIAGTAGTGGTGMIAQVYEDTIDHAVANGIDPASPGVQKTAIVNAGVQAGIELLQIGDLLRVAESTVAKAGRAANQSMLNYAGQLMKDKKFIAHMALDATGEGLVEVSQDLAQIGADEWIKAANKDGYDFTEGTKKSIVNAMGSEGITFAGTFLATSLFHGSTAMLHRAQQKAPTGTPQAANPAMPAVPLPPPPPSGTIGTPTVPAPPSPGIAGTVTPTITTPSGPSPVAPGAALPPAPPVSGTTVVAPVQPAPAQEPLPAAQEQAVPPLPATPPGPVYVRGEKAMVNGKELTVTEVHESPKPGMRVVTFEDGSFVQIPKERAVTPPLKESWQYRPETQNPPAPAPKKNVVTWGMDRQIALDAMKVPVRATEQRGEKSPTPSEQQSEDAATAFVTENPEAGKAIRDLAKIGQVSRSNFDAIMGPGWKSSVEDRTRVASAIAKAYEATYPEKTAKAVEQPPAKPQEMPKEVPTVSKEAVAEAPKAPESAPKEPSTAPEALPAPPAETSIAPIMPTSPAPAVKERPVSTPTKTKKPPTPASKPTPEQPKTVQIKPGITEKTFIARVGKANYDVRQTDKGNFVVPSRDGEERPVPLKGKTVEEAAQHLQTLVGKGHAVTERGMPVEPPAKPARKKKKKQPTDNMTTTPPEQPVPVTKDAVEELASNAVVHSGIPEGSHEELMRVNEVRASLEAVAAQRGTDVDTLLQKNQVTDVDLGHVIDGTTDPSYVGFDKGARSAILATQVDSSLAMMEHMFTAFADTMTPKEQEEYSKDLNLGKNDPLVAGTEEFAYAMRIALADGTKLNALQQRFKEWMVAQQPFVSEYYEESNQKPTKNAVEFFYSLSHMTIETNSKKAAEAKVATKTKTKKAVQEAVDAVNNAKQSPKAILSTVTEKATVESTSGIIEFPVTYALVDVNDVKSSFTGGANAELQARSGSKDSAKAQEVIRSIANKPRTTLVQRSPSAEGMPIVSSDLQAVTNHRIEGLRQSEGEGRKQYENMMYAALEGLGFTEAQARAMKKPILVRVLSTPSSDKITQKIADSSNASLSRKMETNEIVLNIAARAISDRSIEDISNVVTNIESQGGEASMSEIIDEIMKSGLLNDAVTWLDKMGITGIVVDRKLTQLGRKYVSLAILARSVMSNEGIKSTDPSSRMDVVMRLLINDTLNSELPTSRAMTGVIQSAPYLAELKQLATEGKIPEYLDVRKQLIDALYSLSLYDKMVESAINSGAIASEKQAQKISDFLQEEDMLDDRVFSEEQIQFATLLNSLGKSQVAVRAFLQSYVARLRETQEGSGDMFSSGEPKPMPESFQEAATEAVKEAMTLPATQVRPGAKTIIAQTSLASAHKQLRNAAPGAGRSRAEVVKEVTAFLGETPRNVEVVDDARLNYGAQIDLGSGMIVINAARVGNVRDALLEEGLHAVWSDPRLQKAWQHFKDGITAEEITKERDDRASKGMDPVSDEIIREEVAIAKVLANDKKSGSAISRLLVSVMDALKRFFGVGKVGARAELLNAAQNWLRRGGVKGTGVRSAKPSNIATSGTKQISEDEPPWSDEAKHYGHFNTAFFKNIAQSIRTAIKEGKQWRPEDSLYNLVADIARWTHFGPTSIGRHLALEKGVLGFFDAKNRFMAIRKANYFDTWFHEFGHELHAALFGRKKDNTAEVTSYDIPMGKDQIFHVELKKVYGNSFAHDTYPEYEHVSEGFAEWVKLFIADRTQAEQLAPQWTAYFETELEKRNPYVKSVLDVARLRLGNILEFARKRPLMGVINYAGPHNISSLDERLTDYVRQFFDRDVRLAQFVADVGGIDDATKDPLILARRARGRVSGELELMITKGTWNPRDKKFVLTQGTALMDALRGLIGKDLFKFEMFQEAMLAHRVIEERSRQGRDNTGFWMEEANALSVLKTTTTPQLQAFLKDVYANHPDVVKAMQEFQKFDQWFIKTYATGNGLITDESAKLILKYHRYYLPMKIIRDIDADAAMQGGGKRRAFSGAQSGIQRTANPKGRQIEPPLAEYFKHITKIVANAKYNEVPTAFAEMIENGTGEEKGRISKWVRKVPAPVDPYTIYSGEVAAILKNQLGISIDSKGDLNLPAWLNALGHQERLDMIKAFQNLHSETFYRKAQKGPNGENLIVCLRNGEPYWMEVKDQRLFDTLTGKYEAAVHKGSSMWMLGTMSRLLRAGATQYNPGFFIPNFISDLTQCLILSGKALSAGNFSKRLRGMKEAFLKGDIYNLFLASGAPMSGVTDEFKMLDPSAMDIQSLTFMKKQYLGGLVRGNSLAEVAGDIARFRWISELNGIIELSNRLGEFEVLRDGSKLRSALYGSGQGAADITLDYNRGGTFTKEWNMIIPFLNAGALNIAKIAEAAKKRPGQVAARIIPILIGPSLISLMSVYWGDDDDEYYAIPADMRDRYWFVRSGSDGAGKPVWLKIKKPYGWAFFSNLFERTIAKTIGYDYTTGKRSGDPKAFEGFAQGLIFRDLLPSPNIAGMLPLFEWATGFSTYRWQRIVPLRDESKEPWQQGAENASSFAKMLSYYLYNTAGSAGKGVTPTWLEDRLTPAHIDQAISGFLAGAGSSAAIALGEGIDHTVTGGQFQGSRPKEFPQYPIVRSFLERSARGNHRALSEFYERKTEIARLVKTIKDPSMAQRVQERVAVYGPANLLWEHVYRNADTQMRGVFTKLHQVYASQMSVEEKVKLSDQLYDQAIQIASRAVGAERQYIRMAAEQAQKK